MSASTESTPKETDAPASVATEEQDNVHVHTSDAKQAQARAEALTQNQALAPLPDVFAEVWKNGMRVASIYTNGHADSSTALGGTNISGTGALYARMRADEISRQVGGEVRFVNIEALQVEVRRTQLRAAYGV